MCIGPFQMCRHEKPQGCWHPPIHTHHTHVHTHCCSAHLDALSSHPGGDVGFSGRQQVAGEGGVGEAGAGDVERDLRVWRGVTSCVH
jgi:hypothetical protein